MQYRREIDGMRAVAVAPVVLHHAGFAGVPGGFAGVDVFFVISGYLIASIIFAQKAAGSFSLPGFYERRARRILPALLLVVLSSLPPALLWMPQVQLEEFLDSVVAVVLFVSNFLFWDQTGYFGAAAETKPLLHTWSLAIEEQFYLLFPVMALALWRLRRLWFATAWIVLALASLAASHYASQVDPSANFYFSPMRFWELLIGVLLATAERDRPIRTRVPAAIGEGLAGAGLLAVLATFFVFDRTTPFPGLHALLPTLGTGLVLGFAHGGTLTGRLLGQRFLVGIGLISYSLYLWHQPLFAFARLRSVDEPAPLLYAVLVAAAVALAWLSWRFVERPFRDGRRIGPRAVFATVGAGCVGLLAVGLAGRFSGITELERRFDFSPDQLAAVAPANGNDAVGTCRWDRPVAGFRRIRSCGFGAADGATTIVLFGDSHAEALFSALDERFRREGVKGILLRNRYCGPIVGVYEWADARASRHEDCVAAHNAMLNYIRRLPAHGLIVSVRWTFQLYPIPGEIETIDFDNGEGGAGGENQRTYLAFRDGRFTVDGAVKADALRHTLESFRDTGLPLFLVYPVPEVGWRVGDYNFRHLIAGRAVPSVISVDYRHYARRQRFVLGQLDAVEGNNLVRIRPAELLCDTHVRGRCVAQLEGRPFYNDDDHLANDGAAMVADLIVRQLRHSGK